MKPIIEKHTINTDDFVGPNNVYLVSADLPGCGSTTLARTVAEAVGEETGTAPDVINIGMDVRHELGVRTEDDFTSGPGEIANPLDSDEKYYAGIPSDRPVVIDGKFATTLGPVFLGDSDRPLVAIDLTSNPLVSAVRTLKKENFSFEEMFSAKDIGSRLLERYAKVGARAERDREIKGGLVDQTGAPKHDLSYFVNTSTISLQEVIDYFTVDEGFENFVPDWEVEAVRQSWATLAYMKVMFSSSMHPNDAEQFDYQIGRIKFNLERLQVQVNPAGINEVRGKLKKAITDCWFSIMMKEAPRFFKSEDDGLILDNESQQWSPEYYKVAEGWPVLRTLLEGKDILDPFAGAGTLVHYLASRDIPKTATLSDIGYADGAPVDGDGHVYVPELNAKTTQLFFDNLPSWYKPDLTNVTNYDTADARELPYADDSFDYIVSDPPYGKNCKTGGIGLLLGSLSEFRRVAKEGSILMVPTEWVGEVIAAEGEERVTVLTRDVSRGLSKSPVCYILVK